MSTVISGKAIAKQVRLELKAEVDQLAAQGVHPGLAVVLVGEDPASAIYVRNKVRSCKKVGIASFSHTLPEDTAQSDLLALIDELNRDDRVDGILVQLPLPGHIDKDAITGAVAVDKDVDGFGAENLGKLVAAQPTLVACTPAGVMRMLADYSAASGFSIEGKRAIVIGRSVTVGKPMSLLLLNANATVTTCHSRTRDLPAHLAEADIVIAAAGIPELVRGEHLKPGAVVIDVGIHRRDDGSLCGDVHFDSAAEVAAAISPVPGGVGPMTIAMLLANTVEAAKARRAS